ncbi:U-box domain-containing protein 17-like [Olea europaea var. sylvestris]|uniref:RING-type E3 ubiquitin transferase n=1 Tax=Olea europaea subsp. europaea TaxID=158383 RepID=A0A8S0U7W3_OLEEU|nr:U-box domain-containing protein 17-like [Olea europaea var. sylvestris]CAA3011859.1 U-box domain-containing 17 [Olea europaea subsp. europaea]
MVSAAIFSSLRRRRSPSLEAFLAPVDLPNAALLETLHVVSRELISSFSGDNKMLPFFQRKNSKSLIRKIQVLSVLLDSFREMGLSKMASTALLCFKELYLLLYRSKILLDYIKFSSKLWLLLQNQSISGHFHDLNQEISTLLDVFPIEVNSSKDVKEQVELLREQSRKSKLMIDKHDDSLRLMLYYFLNEFENGRIPDPNELRSFFVEKLAICDAKSCRIEIEFLEEQIVNHDGDIEPTVPILNGLVALMRYCRFLLFRFEEEEGEFGKWKHKKNKKGLITREIADTFVTIPKDFCCPISLDLMRDPVTVSTGQTYDRESISRWMEEGHFTCPKTGQMLGDTQLVPNRALRNLITQWCMALGISHDPLESSDSSVESFVAGSPSKAAIEVSKATASLLVQQLANGTQSAKTVAAREIRLLAKTGRENRVCIAEAGAIPHLKTLLISLDAFAQENSVTALLNLSIYDKNKCQIMNAEGCLGSIARVLRVGHTIEARENAAATLFSLSSVHEYKKRIAEEDGALEALSTLLKEGTPRGKKDAVTALFNLSTHTENCVRMIESGAVTALVGALGNNHVSEEAAGALALIVRQPIGAESVGNEEMAVLGLIGMMRCGTSRGKENAVAALLELCRRGGAAATERVSKAPALASLLHSLLFTGTKRARRKAASLARVFQRCENTSLHFGGLGVGYVYAGNSAADRDTSFAGDVSVPLSISVSVL